jgi:hypothetical protein
MGMNRTTAFHAGTHNDCGLHTIASMTGMSEEAVVKALGLSQRDIEHISAHGIEPDQFTAMMSYLNNGDVMHRHGTAAELVNDFLPNVPDGHQFAVGMQRPDGIGHLVAAERVGDHLQIHDRQIGTRTDLHSQEELNDYMWRQGATRVHTWYNKNYSGTPSNAGHPQAGHPQAGHPQAGHPQAYPQGGHPQAYPQGGYPQAYPQGGYPYGGWK